MRNDSKDQGPRAKGLGYFFLCRVLGRRRNITQLFGYRKRRDISKILGSFCLPNKDFNIVRGYRFYQGTVFVAHAGKFNKPS